MKIIYSGIQRENYNPDRGRSFEYGNFYLTLKTLPGIEVIEYPFDPIIQIGRKRFNQELLDLVEKEKPDLFFAFMLSDELDPAVLNEIKRLTTSVAWFADDHWRLWNYSRYYAPHFTWNITTWSKAPAAYADYGIKNVIRSQWACNTNEWKPAEVVSQDIDVSFVGQYNSSRGKIIEELRKAGVNVWVRGWGWPEGRLSHAEIIQAFARSKINLNFNTPPPLFNPRMFARIFFRRSLNKIVPSLRRLPQNISTWRHMSIPQIKARPFEILGSKAFLISACADDVEHYYADGKEIVYYDGTIKDLVDKINYYLPREEERRRIAEAGYERTVKEHTYKIRFEQIFKIIGLNR